MKANINGTEKEMNLKPQIHIHLNWLLILIILFWGKPDLHDAIIHVLMK